MSFLLLKFYFLVTSIYLKVTRTLEKHISLLNLVFKICTYAAYLLVSKVKPQLPQFINIYSTSTNHFLITLNNLNIEKELFSNSFVAYFKKQFALDHINWLGFPLTFSQLLVFFLTTFHNTAYGIFYEYAMTCCFILVCQQSPQQEICLMLSI